MVDDASGGAPGPLRTVGRYAIHREIAGGGMATIHLGRLLAPGGFARTVAIKRLHPQYAKDPDFGAMFLDEARLAARIRHPNVVPTLDIVALEGELCLVMEYVAGESLANLLRAARARATRIPPAIGAHIVSSALHGLHGAHEARGDDGQPLAIVHRDVSPQNILVGVDGVTRVIDFGIAKAIGQAHTTREGQIKGKLSYMSPEQLRTGKVTRRSDVFAASIVLWEALTCERLFGGTSEGEILLGILEKSVEPPSALVPGVPAALDAVVMRGLSRAPEDRFATAHEMALAIEAAAGVLPAHEIGAWLQGVAAARLAERASLVAQIESGAFPEGPAAAEPVPSSAGDAQGSITLTTSSADLPRKAGRRGLRAAALAGLAAIGVAAGVALLRGAGKASAPAPTQTAAAAATSAAPMPAVSASASAASEPPEAPSASAETPASASAKAPERPAAKQPRGRPRPARPRSNESLYVRE
jgi:eukaryotic-like serine/threonine-protein kinase